MQQEFSYTSYRTTKSRLLKQLRPFNKKEFRRLINDIVKKNRGIPIVDARRTKFLESPEVIELLQKLGEPLEYYGKEVTFGCSRLTKYQLFTKIPYINTNTFRRKIIKIVMDNRGIPFEEARYLKNLRTNEVRSLFLQIGEPFPEFE